MRRWFWQSRCPSVLGGDGEYPDIRCQLRPDHTGRHFNHRRLSDGSETYQWDTAEDTAHKALKPMMGKHG